MMAEELETLLTQLKSPDPIVKGNALNDIPHITHDGVLDIIVPYLKDQDADVRGTAAFSLGEIQDERAVPYLIGFLEQEFDFQQGREQSCGFMALENYKDPSVLQYLLKEIDKPKVSRLPRQYVAKLLRNFDTDASIAALFKLLQEDDDWIVQYYAGSSLLLLNKIRLLPTWEAVLTDNTRTHNTFHMKQIARQAIAQITNRTSRKKRQPRLIMRMTRKAKHKCGNH